MLQNASDDAVAGMYSMNQRHSALHLLGAPFVLHRPLHLPVGVKLREKRAGTKESRSCTKAARRVRV